MPNSTLEEANCLSVLSALLIAYTLIFHSVIAKEFEVQSTFRGSERGSFDIRAWQSKFGSENERQRFLKSDDVNIKATLNADERDVGKNVTLYVLVRIGQSAFMKDSNGAWQPFTGKLIAFDHRTLGDSEEIDIITGLSNVLIDAEIYVGYYKKYIIVEAEEGFEAVYEEDIVYNKEPYRIRIDAAYSKVLTVGKNGDFKDCSGIQLALNVIQDWEEIRIEQGRYQCTGLELPAAKDFKNGGIRISGGWNSTFTEQSTDPSLTVLDGGALILADETIVDRETCEAQSGIWDNIICYQELPETETNKNILTLRSGFVSIESLTFKHVYDGSAIQGLGIQAIGYSNNSSSIENCLFELNTDTHGSAGGSVVSMPFIINSTFNKNNGRAVFGAEMISGSTLTNNYSLYNSSGGAVQEVTHITKSTFINNTANSSGGAVADVKHISHSVFTGNKALESGGAIYKFDKVVFSKFTDNSAAENGGAIDHSSGSSSYSSAPDSVIANCSFTGNSSEGAGGAIEARKKNLIVMNNIFANNHAQKGGAIVSTENSSNYFINNTFVKNKTTEFGGAFYGIGNIYNSIFSENTAAGESNDIHSTGGNADDFILDYSLFNMVTGAVDIRPGFILGDPLFVDSENGNYHLQANSPAINAGDSRFKSDDYALFLKSIGVGNLIDLDNAPRIQDEIIDMGAYEFQ